MSEREQDTEQWEGKRGIVQCDGKAYSGLIEAVDKYSLLFIFDEEEESDEEAA